MRYGYESCAVGLELRVCWLTIWARIHTDGYLALGFREADLLQLQDSLYIHTSSLDKFEGQLPEFNESISS